MNLKQPVSRRRFLSILAVGSAAGLAFKNSFASTEQSKPVKQTRLLMGTVVNLTVVSDDRRAAGAAVTATLDRMAELERLLSRHQPDSQLSQLNRTGRLVPPAPSLLHLLQLSREISDFSGGAFDITVMPLVDLYQHYHRTAGTTPPDDKIQETLSLVNYRGVSYENDGVYFEQPGMSITLDSIAKGYIVDEGVAVLKQHGFTDVLVEAGGDLYASGHKEPLTPWRIGVQSPRESRSGFLKKMQIKNKAAATSGDYMQPFTADLSQHHILDPRTGYSSPELASATVLAPSSARADALATAAMVMGPKDAVLLLNCMPNTEAYLVGKDLQTYQTDFS